MPTMFRHADRRFPFLWESASQPPARWHGEGEGPVAYLADTPDGAWAEFCRHEEISDPADLAGVRRRLWAVDVPRLPQAHPRLPARVLHGDPDSYPLCREEARRLRRRGTQGLTAPSAALEPGTAGGCRTDGGLQPGPARDGMVAVLFGRRPDLVAWHVVDGAPPAGLLDRVAHFRGTPAGRARSRNGST